VSASFSHYKITVALKSNLQEALTRKKWYLQHNKGVLITSDSIFRLTDNK